MPKERRLYSREFKLAALARFEATGNVEGLARELGVRRELLYKWQRKYAAGGATALSTKGRPRPVEAVRIEEGDAGLGSEDGARRRIAELERKVGRQELELDFFRAALQQVKGPARGNDGRGGPASTR
jgi:transposase